MYKNNNKQKLRNQKPVISYGIIIFRIKNGEPNILMINRKDSLCYIDFLRGKYSIHNIKYIQILIDKFSLSEKEKILNNDYDTLWKQLWNITEISDNKFKKDYVCGKHKFEEIQKGIKINNKIINLSDIILKSKTKYTIPEWEFPKGRKERYESNKQCAIREFNEETGINRNDYQLYINVKPLIENYIGENNIKYLHIYYIACINDNEKDLILDKTNKFQSLEISDIQWFNKDEALNKIRDYHKTRKNVINIIFKFIDSLNDYKII
jgi:8-oxo-dGTP pyrophosphatase MutT (NUDIX family)